MIENLTNLTIAFTEKVVFTESVIPNRFDCTIDLGIASNQLAEKKVSPGLDVWTASVVKESGNHH